MATVKLDPEFFNHDAQAGGFFPITHTNPGFDIESFTLGRGKNMVIEGIRGTGKTHILKMIASNCEDKYNDLKILPVYVSLSKVSEWQDSDIRLFRIQLYANIVNSTISMIEENKDKIGYSKSNIEKTIDIFKRMFGLKSEEDIDKILLKIKNKSDELLQNLTYNRDRIIQKARQESEIKGSIKGGKEIQLTYDDLNRYLDEKEIQSMGKTLAYENASDFIIEFFKQLKLLLNCSYVFLLIDECSEASSDAQIEIFRLLKLIRGASTSDLESNYAYFCASVYPPYATNYPSKNKGDQFNFEPGQDAGVEYLQLDELTDEYENFFYQLTKKRLEFFWKKGISDPRTDVFENQEAFILAAYAANGIPRRYLEILKQAYDNLNQRNSPGLVTNRISQSDVQTAIQIVVSNQILSLSKLGTRDFKIIEEISQRIAKRNRQNETKNKDKTKKIPANVYFTIYRSQFSEYNKLLLQGCVHDKGRTRLKKYYKDEGSQGPLLMMDLAVAYQTGAIDKRRVIAIFKRELKENARSGYEYCQDFNLSKFKL